MNIALIVAAGSSIRMRKETPKQFLLFEDKPLFVYSALAFNENKEIDSIVIVTTSQYISQVEEWCEQYQINKVKYVVKGGQTRQESVYNGLLAMKKIAKDDDIVLIHDAARPLINQQIINDNISCCLKFGAVTTVIPANDTIIHSCDGECIDDVLNRKELYQCQTPQTFKYSIIKKAHEAAQNNNATDDTQLVLPNHKIHFVQGNKANFKVTTPEDLILLKAFKNSL